MEIQKVVNSVILAKKLNAMFDYVVWLELYSKDNFILIGDRHGTDRMECKDVKNNTRIIKECTIRNRVDRREFTKKLKGMTECDIIMTFDSEHSLIILDGIRTKEQSSYFCTTNPAKNMDEVNGKINWGFDTFKKILGIE